MKVFFDSSAMTKRYVAEVGTDVVSDTLSNAKELGVSVLCFPEIMSAMNRLKRERKMDAQQYHTNKQLIASDLEDVTICNLTAESVVKAVALMESGSLKTLDALQIAGALEWQCDLFVTFDVQQSKAAKKAGLRVT